MFISILSFVRACSERSVRFVLRVLSANKAAKYEETDFAERVLKSALTRFDEPPLRFVEPKDDGHPMLEMIERLFSAKWRLPVADKRSDVKNEPPKDNSENP